MVGSLNIVIDNTLLLTEINKSGINPQGQMEEKTIADERAKNV